jgi:hypothetical protein
MGRGEVNVVEALKNIRASLPFPLKGIDSDNGSEFINYHLFRYCGRNRIQFTRGRPYKKDDNAHIEQKNWTHVRKIFGWQRYDTYELLQAMNDLYQKELSLMMNLFQPSAKLIRKQRVGSRVQRKHDAPRTPLDRLVQHYQKAKKPIPKKLLILQKLPGSIDPFALAQSIDKKLNHIQQLLSTSKPKHIQPQEYAYAQQAR